MELIYNIKNRILLVGGIVISATVVLLLAQFVFADSTSSLLPSSDGAYLQWTPKTGTTHYTMVDESSCNGKTDYNSTNTVGNRDSYGVSLASVPSGSTITAIEITPCASRNSNGSGSATMNVFYRWSGVDSSDAGNYALTGTTPTQLAATTFSGLSLSRLASSTLEIGAVLSAGTKGARLSRVAVVVTYTPAAPSVTTSAATSITASSAALNGSANPNGASTTGWFRYSATNPGTCDDVFGTRVPTSGGTNLGSGTSPVSYSNGVSGLSSGTTYYYCAIASNSGGTGFGGIVSFTTVPPAPAAPSSLGATNISGSQNDLAWTDNSSNEDGFKVEQSLNNQFGPFSQVATTSADAVSYSNTGLTADQTYYYRVRAFNSGGNSGYTNTAYAITATVVPSDPSNLTATASSSSAVLNWTQSSTNEGGFKVERGTDGVNFTEIATKGINATNHVDPGLAPGTYYYRVRAFNVIGNSGYSNTASTTIP
ncbi:MAG: hypothetical protein A3J46_04505 [Candidatus Yanofskybacteria bacterium RIFCSPHIGHO2_02_FULL_41_11]|uniref:Fibronectin type-III domain-containing protein n=1 Tax=Candidatus Yanofskybacteria bacterium RIFCSPHIGHO2_02_FULL_41_11 TaxID=1802675 RepID=A0A1F8F9Y7_9BACT|nr:MAG: hypothetical protein A3J46_04505 [Candidatus Yanofskybacteria bacterium RIFCSPHIGHO2_02_FULL_41_11]